MENKRRLADGIPAKRFVDLTVDTEPPIDRCPVGHDWPLNLENNICSFYYCKECLIGSFVTKSGFSNSQPDEATTFKVPALQPEEEPEMQHFKFLG